MEQEQRFEGRQDEFFYTFKYSLCGAIIVPLFFHFVSKFIPGYTAPESYYKLYLDCKSEAYIIFFGLIVSDTFGALLLWVRFKISFIKRLTKKKIINCLKNIINWLEGKK